MSSPKRPRRASQKARPNQVGEAIRSVLAELLLEGGLKDPRIQAAGLVTITDVEVTPDLRSARAFVSVYGEDSVIEGVIEGLNAASGAAQREIARRLELRYTPKVEFVRDDSIAYGAKIEALLHDIEREKE
jgi:ribosome-binding factor A